MVLTAGFCQFVYDITFEHNEKMAWWRNAKFGMFVHWGPYCLYGGVYNGFNQRRGGAEWIMNR